MHSRIFVYSKNNKIKKSNITTSSFNEHWFTNNIADYVVNSSLHEDIKWLKATLNDLPIDVDIDRKYIISHDDFKTMYFKDKYNKFIELLVKKKDDITLDKFSSSNIYIFNDLWQLNNLYNDKYSFYFCNEGIELLTMDEFVRKMEDDCKYYIIKTFDYHF
ncbi:hypothetical protein JYG23_08750 [Sedimentibacter sp. zth1]|uniref:hypothetical protein n=1 Tax=Sedimentibacter sp. zth1 TaxID=2816908 RepID=UPI001A918A23|nr:hypothetical protein [Sedimentibacter sp. zth1]QSX04795.1 hypothetical protein JYG23_08750 [Sedimentibacter sp. zth1]